MIRLNKLIANCLGIGYIKGGGTIAAAVSAVIWYLVQAKGASYYAALMVTLVIVFIGVWSGNKVEPDWGKDNSKVVIDEVAGMCISLLFIPVEWKYVITGLALFRFFDMVKPLLIRRTERLPGGWGVIADDVLAGLYSNLLLHVIVWYNLF